jgi:predicted AAA+ superfamily ATPase
MSSPKFYFFDLGVVNTILGRFSLIQGSPEYGKVFEHLTWRELRSAIGYFRSLITLSYWRSLSKIEVDFILSDASGANPQYAIEVKAKSEVSQKDFKGLLAFAEEYPQVRKIVVCLEPIRRNTEQAIEIWPIREFLADLWEHKFF